MPGSHIKKILRKKNIVMNVKKEQETLGRKWNYWKSNSVPDLRKTLDFKDFSELHLGVTIDCNLSRILLVILQILSLNTDSWILTLERIEARQEASAIQCTYRMNDTQRREAEYLPLEFILSFSWEESLFADWFCSQATRTFYINFFWSRYFKKQLHCNKRSDG